MVVFNKSDSRLSTSRFARTRARICRLCGDSPIAERQRLNHIKTLFTRSHVGFKSDNFMRQVVVTGMLQRTSRAHLILQRAQFAYQEIPIVLAFSILADQS